MSLRYIQPMSIAKLPIILLLTFAYNAMFTPPNPPAAKEELVTTSKIDRVSGRVYFLQILRLGQTLLGAVEITAIIAGAFPSSSVSQRILRALLFEEKDPASLSLYPLSYLAIFLWISGYAIRMSAYQDLGRFFRYDISIQKGHRLFTTGVYAYARHPSYTAIIITDLGWVLWHGTRGSWIRESAILESVGGTITLITFIMLLMLPPVWTLSRMSNEDKALKNKFGKEWDDWASKVPYRLIPGIY